ncbi:MAG: type III toxin-antitoxin system CptIN family toxin [[Clostridium] leptum]
MFTFYGKEYNNSREWICKQVYYGGLLNVLVAAWRQRGIKVRLAYDCRLPGAGYKNRCEIRPIVYRLGVSLCTEEIMDFVEHGLYIVSHQYFTDFPSKHWMQNKSERRPHYYALKDKSGIIWLIPMSTQVENYKRKIEREEIKRGKGNCIYYHIGKIAGKERVFIISDLFPVTTNYIVKPYTISSIEYIVKNEKMNKEIKRKTLKYLRLLEQHQLSDNNNIIDIKRQLLTK